MLIHTTTREGESARAAVRSCRSVLMVGTHPEALGGVSAVVRTYRDGGLFDRFGIVYVASHRSGGGWIKARQALVGWLSAALCLAKLDAPLVHVHTASRASFWRKSLICLMARAAGRPYLVHLHGGGFARFYHEECGSLQRRFVRSVLARAALVIAVSDEWRAALRRICPAARIEVLPNAVALPAPSAVGARGGEPHTLLFLGQLHREKGVFDLVRAFARIAPRFPEARLVCAGDGAVRDVEALARELGVAARVHCPGWLDGKHKERALATAGLFILPSYTEGLPMALLEAMAWGLPVIASPVGGIPQVVKPDENGLLVPAGDVERIGSALECLLADPERALRLGAAARATVETRFGLDSALAHLAEIYARFGIAPASPRRRGP